MYSVRRAQSNVRKLRKRNELQGFINAWHFLAR